MRKRKNSKCFYGRRGFTLVELLIGSTIMVVVILATLTLYMRS
ncbi:MAG: prepilin-type N-terminal cleavage/methylation domain-containing protein, partial [Candidatus Aminicenantes bacterium]|nr:prepilin-type N-terminal cleavage/methylation domain-containing protein [Candidatus Aminicenantes bacterium]